MLRFLLFVGGVMMASTSMAEGVSSCSFDTIPIQIIGEGGSGSVITLSENAAKPNAKNWPINGSHTHFFGSFVTAVTKHVAARLDKENLCTDSTKSKERSLLQFMHWRIFTITPDGPTTPVTLLDARPSNGCLITSPWIDIAIERKPVPWIRAIVRWNERQLAADQAVLAGVQNVPPGVAKPLTQRELGQMLYDYEIMGSSPKLIEERVPPDILWLLRSSRWRGSRYFVSGTPIAVEKGADGYTKIVLTLIDRCFDSDGNNLQYNNVLDIADPILLGQYKIDKLLD